MTLGLIPGRPGELPAEVTGFGERNKLREGLRLAAIAFALEGDPRDYDTDAETLALDMNVAPAA